MEHVTANVIVIDGVDVRFARNVKRVLYKYNFDELAQIEKLPEFIYRLVPKKIGRVKPLFTTKNQKDIEEWSAPFKTTVTRFLKFKSYICSHVVRSNALGYWQYTITERKHEMYLVYIKSFIDMVESLHDRLRTHISFFFKFENRIRKTAGKRKVREMRMMIERSYSLVWTLRSYLHRSKMFHDEIFW